MSTAAARPAPDRRAALLARLGAVLPRSALLAAPEDMRPFECDGLAAHHCLPLAVALPANEAEVAAVLAACHALQVPVVARGAGTGLSGGAMPVADGLLLSLAKLDRILSVDPLARTAR